MNDDTNNTKKSSIFRTIHHYDNIFYCSFADCATEAVYRAREYTLTYVISGEIVLSDGFNSNYIHPGECAFIPREFNISVCLKAYEGQPYSGISILFTRTYLKKMYRSHKSIQIPCDTPRLYSASMKLPHTTDLTKLFSELMPYCDERLKPAVGFMPQKAENCLDTLLRISYRFVPTLFDFKKKWNVDIIDFLNLNYASNLSVADMAHYTGRSLATFKRDFSKISPLSPMKWLIYKRLDIAYERLKENQPKIAELAAEVGFKNTTHFATAFKSRHGQAPSIIAKTAKLAKFMSMES